MARRPASDRQPSSLRPVTTQTDRLIRRLGGRRGFVSAQILTQWPVIVGAALARNTMPARIVFPRAPGGGWDRSNGVLHLKVAASAWAPEVQHLAPLIIKNVNTFFGYNAVAELRIKIGPLPQRFVPPPPRPPAAEDVARVAETVERVADPGLREALAALGRAIATPRPPAPPPAPPPPRPDSSWRPRLGAVVPPELQPEVADLILLRRLGRNEYRATICYGWSDAAAQLADAGRQRPHFWYFREEDVTPEQMRNLPAEALTILKHHKALVEISRRAGTYEYFPPLRGQAPLLDRVVRDWIANQGLDAWIFSDAQGVRRHLERFPARYPSVRAVRACALELGWIEPDPALDGASDYDDGFDDDFGDDGLDEPAEG